MLLRICPESREPARTGSPVPADSQPLPRPGASGEASGRIRVRGGTLSAGQHAHTRPPARPPTQVRAAHARLGDGEIWQRRWSPDTERAGHTARPVPVAWRTRTWTPSRPPAALSPGRAQPGPVWGLCQPLTRRLTCHGVTQCRRAAPAGPGRQPRGGRRRFLACLRPRRSRPGCLTGRWQARRLSGRPGARDGLT